MVMTKTLARAPGKKMIFPQTAIMTDQRTAENVEISTQHHEKDLETCFN